MQARPLPDLRLALRVEATARESNEVGSIVLDGRLLVVHRASDSQLDAPGLEVCRIEVGGISLVVSEAPDRRRPNEVLADDELSRRLTGRELEIAVLVAQGLANKNIAYRLKISEWTVTTYIRRIFAKLDVESRAAMVYRCAPLINRVVNTQLSAQPPKPRGSRQPESRPGPVGRKLHMT
jgi:DNA-binding CsgD family transcriptional regulator